jgi:hypothetical protein
VPGLRSSGPNQSFEAVLLISGQVAAGKTTLADRIARATPGSRRATFSAGLRALAARESVSISDRSDLQNYGQVVATSRPWELWQSTVELASPHHGPNLVVDGLRHLHIFEELRRRHPGAVGLLVVTPPPAIIQARLGLRGESLDVTAHIVESEGSKLAAVADVVLRNSAATDPDGSAIAKTFSWLWR